MRLCSSDVIVLITFHYDDDKVFSVAHRLEKEVRLCCIEILYLFLFLGVYTEFLCR
jgi:hypothetical protein